MLVLVLANAMLLAAQWGLFDSLTGGTSVKARADQQREPGRVQRQIAPDAVQILSPQAANAALVAAAASAAQPAVQPAAPPASLPGNPALQRNRTGGRRAPPARRRSRHLQRVQ